VFLSRDTKGHIGSRDTATQEFYNRGRDKLGLIVSRKTEGFQDHQDKASLEISFVSFASKKKIVDVVHRSETQPAEKTNDRIPH
jgi:hypothetical protein